jgi:hypothetical protein
MNLFPLCYPIGTLSYYPGLGYRDLRKVLRNLVDVISMLVAAQMFGYLSFAFASALIVLRV